MEKKYARHKRKFTIHIRGYSIILLTILILQCATGAWAAVTVTSTSVAPEILMPGDNGIVTVTITNTEDYSTDETSPVSPYIESIYLDGSRDIKVTGGNSRFEGPIGNGQSIDISFLIEAKRTGIFLPELLIRLRNQENIRYPIPVNVNTQVAVMRQPALVLYQEQQKNVRPGDDIPITFILTNQGESPAREVTIRMLDNDADIAPGERNAWYISLLEPGKSHTETIRLLTDPKARPGIHEIPIVITYTSTDGTTETIDSTFSIALSGDADLAIASVVTDPIRPGPNDPFDLIIRIENTGSGDATSVQADIDLPFIGIKQVFLGTIEPDSNAPAVFLLTADAAGPYEYQITYRYQDDLGSHETNTSLTLVVGPHENGLIYGALVLILILVLVGGYWYMKRNASHG